MRMADKINQQGQVLLIVVLVMVVALTVGLSVATRSITNLRTTTEEENSQRAFAAAEAGVERALQEQNDLVNPITFGNKASIKNVKYETLDDDSLVLNNNSPISKNYGFDVWFARNPDGTLDTGTNVWGNNSTLTFYWGDDAGDTTSGCGDAALEVVFLSNSAPGAPIVTTHQLVDRCVGRGSNNATQGFIGETGPYSSSIAGRNFAQYVRFENLNRIIHIRVIPLYESTRIGVATNAGVDLPPQGEKITSTGESGETFRKIEVTRPYPGIPAELFSVLFSPAGS